MKPKSRFFPVLILLLAITILVTVHEFGHFLMCKLFNVRTPVFSIGFGPRLFGITIGQTLFQIAAIPLGGYVSINEADIALIPYYKKIIIILAGVGFNLIFAALLFFFIFWSRKGQQVPVIASVSPESPAEKAGLEVGDRILKIENIEIGEDINTLLRIIAENPHNDITLLIARENEIIEIPVKLGAQFAGRLGTLGVSFDIDTSTHHSIISALKNAVATTWNMLAETARAFFGIFKRRKNRAPLLGPIDLVTSTTHNTQKKWLMFALLLSSFSIQLAFFNTLPVPFFDGGKAALFTVEAIMGKPLTPAIIGIINLITMMLLVAFLLYSTFRDMRTMRK